MSPSEIAARLADALRRGEPKPVVLTPSVYPLPPPEGTPVGDFTALARLGGTSGAAKRMTFTEQALLEHQHRLNAALRAGMRLCQTCRGRGYAEVSTVQEIYALGKSAPMVLHTGSTVRVCSGCTGAGFVEQEG